MHVRGRSGCRTAAMQRARAETTVFSHDLVRRVVAGAHDVTEDGRVEQTVRGTPRVHSPGDELHRVVRHDHRPASERVQRAHLARGEESTPATLEVVDPLACERKQRPVAVHEHMDTCAHGAEVRLSCHGSPSWWLRSSSMTTSPRYSCCSTWWQCYSRSSQWSGHCSLGRNDRLRGGSSRDGGRHCEGTSDTGEARDARRRVRSFVRGERGGRGEWGG